YKSDAVQQESDGHTVKPSLLLFIPGALCSFFCWKFKKMEYTLRCKVMCNGGELVRLRSALKVESTFDSDKDLKHIDGVVYWEESKPSHFSRKPSIRISDNEEGNWVCLYTDGTMKLDPRLASTGGALRDRYGGWIIGYNKNLDNKDAIEAIHESFSKTSPSALIRHIQHNLMDIGKWKLEFISQEMNLKAHFI
ncbi:hypothetical protein Gorai_021697, partial [Gossypium raimondii]|nr:hypothetical protein [Gossypium raimondii]